jgi:hypothetical protein
MLFFTKGINTLNLLDRDGEDELQCMTIKIAMTDIRCIADR